MSLTAEHVGSIEAGSLTLQMYGLQYLHTFLVQGKWIMPQRVVNANCWLRTINSKNSQARGQFKIKFKDPVETDDLSKRFKISQEVAGLHCAFEL